MAVLELPSTSEPLAVRGTVAEIDRHQLLGSLSADAAEALRGVVRARVAPLLSTYAHTAESIASSRTLNDAGKLDARAALVARTRAELTALRLWADAEAAAFNAFSSVAEHRVQLRDGEWTDRPHIRDPHEAPLRREVRDAWLSRGLSNAAALLDARARYLTVVERHGHNTVSDAVEEAVDPLALPEFVAILDQRTTDLAREFRLKRTGIWRALEGARLRAALADTIVARAVRALDLPALSLADRKAAAG